MPPVFAPGLIVQRGPHRDRVVFSQFGTVVSRQPVPFTAALTIRW